MARILVAGSVVLRPHRLFLNRFRIFRNSSQERTEKGPCDPPWTPERPALCPAAGSGRASLRRTRDTAYGCSLPGLTGFTAPSRAGPDHQRCTPGAARSFGGRGRIINPAYRGFPAKGTPNPPASTAPHRIACGRRSARCGDGAPSLRHTVFSAFAPERRFLARSSPLTSIANPFGMRSGDEGI